MLRVLRMEVFITLKNKAVFLVLATAVCFFVFFAVMMYYSPTGSITSSQDVSVSRLQTDTVSGNKNTYIDYCEKIICSDAVIMFIAIFAAVMALQEYSGQYIKSIWLSIRKPKYLFWSKLILIFLFCAALISLVFLTMGICNAVAFHAEIGEVSPFLKILPVQLLLETVMGLVIVFTARLIKKPVAAVIVCVAYVSFAHQIICSVIDLLANKLGGVKDFAVDTYLLYGNILLINSDAIQKDVERAVVVAVIFGVGAYAAGRYIFSSVGRLEV